MKQNMIKWFEANFWKISSGTKTMLMRQSDTAFLKKINEWTRYASDSRIEF
ncbi:hypothetical protein AVT41_gp24 [Streptococcus phage APCM01]|uniref:hypothetical protein n=1 Tax=Streptococcus phage APCM01 TaxID=1647391 RepID=UPI00067A6381|nr:hypothetical protein AVT41_gp24 [Streptococcus phage APCM01]AKI28585.1 hypothetical protein APCM01_024 [Streptococcus phage APCM01]